MKTLWNVVSFLAVVHLLALALFVGWLWQTDRLDDRRVQAVRSIFASTIAENEAQAQAARLEAERASLLAAEEGRRAAPSLPSADRVRTVSGAQADDARSVRRINDVKAQLSREIELAETQIQEQRAALDADRQQFEGGLAADTARRQDDQLGKSVKLLEGLPPKQAKQNLVDLVSAGRIDQAVIYLDRMNPRAATKILQQFKTPEESQLATELLERIRTLGSPPM